MAFSEDQLRSLHFYGKVYYINYKQILKDHSDSKLAQLINASPDEKLQGYFVPRSGELFAHILDYYTKGEIHFPHNICPDVIEDELQFWGLPPRALALCCWNRYQIAIEDRHFKERVKKIWIKEEQDTVKTDTETCRGKLHCFLYQPKTRLAKIWSYFLLFIISVSVVTFMVETLAPMREFLVPEFEETFHNLTERRILYFFMHTKVKFALAIAEAPLSCILTLEFFLKAISYPSFQGFIKDANTIIDFIGIAPLWPLCVMYPLRVFRPALIYNSTFVQVYFALNLSRALRVCRLIRFTHHYKSLRLIFLALRFSLKELFLLFITITIVAIIFATTIFLADIAEDNFWSIPAGLWWAFVTMTTVGYGDFYPRGVFGYVVGILCAMMGILIIAIPVPVIVNNFSRLQQVTQILERERYRNEKQIVDDKAAAVGIENKAFDSSFKERAVLWKDTKKVSLSTDLSVQNLE